ncbi:MAG: DUF3240 family protein [Thalassotalea sp.]|nr:DUF3240 family protein [Thalassotalea sp.]
MTDPLVIFTVMSPTELKDEIIDRLMHFEHISGFNLLPINGYSKAHCSFNMEEQVQGYRKLLQFEIAINRQYVDELKALLSPISQRDPLRYWLVEVSEDGHITN